ncbi:MAG TPA: hypothetical protein VNR63_06645 [Gaiellaceae bacterium]|nr:hypothetical protein [Gaiellaceae bacterium]
MPVNSSIPFEDAQGAAAVAAGQASSAYGLDLILDALEARRESG